MRKIPSNCFLGVIPLILGLMFAAGMMFFAAALTERSREHYQAKKHWSKVDFSFLTIDGKTSKQKPKREKTWSETLSFYEVTFLILGLPLLLYGLGLTRITFGTRPARNPLGLSDFARRGALGMVCLILLSTGIFLLYIWSLRIGLL